MRGLHSRHARLQENPTMNTPLLNYYQAIEKASQEMLEAARKGNWDEVLKLEGACALLISQLKHSAAAMQLGADETQFKSRIMQRILVNDAEIRQLAEPWLDELNELLAVRPSTIH
jgi:flagellar protein FliT